MTCFPNAGDFFQDKGFMKTPGLTTVPSNQIFFFLSLFGLTELLVRISRTSTTRRFAREAANRGLSGRFSEGCSLVLLGVVTCARLESEMSENLINKYNLAALEGRSSRWGP